MRFFPRPHEVALFVVLALFCTLVASQIAPLRQDLAMAALSLPTFFVAAFMGFRRSAPWLVKQEADADEDQ